MIYSVPCVVYFSIIFRLCEACFPSPALDRNPSGCQKILKCHKRSSTRVNFLFRLNYKWFASLEPGVSISSAYWGHVYYHCQLRDLNVLLSNLQEVEGIVWLRKERLSSPMCVENFRCVPREWCVVHGLQRCQSAGHDVFFFGKTRV